MTSGPCQHCGRMTSRRCPGPTGMCPHDVVVCGRCDLCRDCRPRYTRWTGWTAAILAFLFVVYIFWLMLVDPRTGAWR